MSRARAFTLLTLPILFFLPNFAVAAPIADPIQFCHALTDALADGDEGKATDIMMANEPDKSREAGVRSAAQRLVSTMSIFNKDGGVKFRDMIGNRQFGKSIDWVYFFYVIGKTDVYVRCRLRNTGAGWMAGSVDVNTDLDKLLVWSTTTP